MKKLFLVHFIVYCFNFSSGHQCFQYSIQISTFLSLASNIQLANLIAKRVDQQNSKIELETKGLRTISLIDTVIIWRKSYLKSIISFQWSQ
jgi:hypothetical protein